MSITKAQAKTSPRWYMRLGRLPTLNRSYNFRDEHREAGASVYEVRRFRRGYQPIVPNKISARVGFEDSRALRPAFMVFGVALRKVGSDDEPLLRRVSRVIKIGRLQHPAQQFPMKRRMR